MGAFPFFSIALPQQGHEEASCASSLPGTVRICTGFLHLLVDVPNFSVQTLSLGFPACTNPSRWEGIWMKPGAAISSAWEMAGNWAAVDATLVSALHSLFGVYMLRCKILEDGRFSVSLSIKPRSSAHSF
jgi:hypothetical protein